MFDVHQGPMSVQTRLSNVLDTVGNLTDISEALREVQNAVTGCSSIVDGCYGYSIWKQVSTSVGEVWHGNDHMARLHDKAWLGLSCILRRSSACRLPHSTK